MAIWNDDLLNLPNGEIDLSYVQRAALLRAQMISARYDRSPDYEESYSFMVERAGLFRIRIRRNAGLRDEGVPMRADLAAEVAKRGVQREI